MDNNLVNLEVDKHVIETILTKQIQTAIAANIGDPREFVKHAVSLALNRKVDKDGDIGRYDSDNKYDFVEILATKTIKKAAKETVREWLEQNKELLKQTVRKELEKKATTSKLINAFVKMAADSISCKWLFSANINFTEVDDD